MTNATATKKDEILNVTCWAKNSRPVSNITWLLDDKVIRQDSTNEGAVETEWLWNHDPQSITQHLLLHVTREDNGKKLVCRVEHLALPFGRIEMSTDIKVIHKPFFETPLSRITMGMFGEPLRVVARASANPPAINYTWTKNSANKVSVAEGPVLNFTRLAVNDSGWYTCTAVNSVGSTTLMYHIFVPDPDAYDFERDKSHPIIASVTCVVLIAVVAGLVALLKFYRCFHWPGGTRLVSQETEPVIRFEHTTQGIFGMTVERSHH